VYFVNTLPTSIEVRYLASWVDSERTDRVVRVLVIHSRKNKFKGNMITYSRSLCLRIAATPSVVSRSFFGHLCLPSTAQLT
jgi:hypothetical protein